MNSGVLITGATGFIGGAVLKYISKAVVVGRKLPCGLSENHSFYEREICPNVDYSECFDNIDIIIHCAARAHIMNDNALDPLAEFHKVNVEGTLNLARQAAAAGVKRFLFISSVKVLGESTSYKSSYNESITPAPEDAYGQSKYEAEEVLKQIASDTEMEVVIIRPPLVYGAGVKANFLSLLKLSSLSVPLPFGAVNNKRSMVYVENLVDFIVRCIDHPKAANQTFLVSDAEDLSLKSLISYIRKAMGRSALLLPIPLVLFRLLGKLTGKNDFVDRLLGDLQVDSTKARELLNWTPPFSVEEGVAETVKDFMSRKN